MTKMATEKRALLPASGKDYGYANARVRGMRSRLLAPTFFEHLLGAANTREIVQQLSATEYESDINEALIRGLSAANVDIALRSNMVRTYQKVLSFANEEAEYVLSTLLGRWDVFNLKSLLRAKHFRLEADDLGGGILPVGTLSSHDIGALAQLEDVKAIVDTVATWGLPFAGPLRDGFSQYIASGELLPMELALDQHYARWATDRLSRRRTNVKIGRRILGLQLDVGNLVMALRQLQADVDGEDAESYFLPGGAEIDLALYLSLVAKSDVDEILNELKKVSYGRLLDEVVMTYLEQNSISIFERALEQALVRHVVSLGRGDPLGVGVGIAYLWAKQNEVTNIRIIVKGKEVGMPLDRIRKELILV